MSAQKLVIAMTASLAGITIAVLPEGAIAAKIIVLAAPELKTIALVPVALFVWPVVNLLGCRRYNPGFAEQPLAVPNAALEIKLGELGHVFGLCAQAPAADFNPARAAFGAQLRNAERLEEARFKELRQGAVR